MVLRDMFQFMPFVMLLVSVLMGATVGLAVRSKQVMVTAMMRYMMLLVIGMTNFGLFFCHLFTGLNFLVCNEVAGCLFYHNFVLIYFAFGLAGVIGFFRKFDFYFAVVIIWTIVSFGMGFEGLYGMIMKGTFSFKYIEMDIYMNFIPPLLLDFLLFYDWYRYNR